MSLNKENRLSLLLPLLLLAVGIYLVPLSIFQSDLSKVPGDFGDARFNNYILEHGYQFMTGKAASFWNDTFMYPFSNVIALSDNLLGTMPLYSVFRMLGSDRETAFQLWLLSLFVLNFICCYWALKKWSGNTILSATGAYIFTFSIFILGHIYNVQCFPRFMVPLVLYWTWKYFRTLHIKYFLFICLGLVYQFYCGIYLGFLLVYVLMFGLLCFFIFYRSFAVFSALKDPKNLLKHAAIAAGAGALMIPLMLPYLEISHKMGMRTFGEALSSIPHLRSYFFTTKAPLLWQSLSDHGIDKLPDWWCHFLFMGALPWIGILSTPFFFFSKKIKPHKKKFLGFLMATLFLCFIFCLNINGFTLYKYIFKLPGFSSMRSINRIINTEVMLFIFVFVYSFNELRKNTAFAKWFVLLVPVLIVVDNLFDPQEVKRYDKKESQDMIAAVRAGISSQYDGKSDAIAFVAADYKGNEIRTNINVMLAAQELGIASVNGYTGSFPKEYWAFLSHVDDRSLKEWCDYTGIKADRIQYINDFNAAEKSRQIIQLKAANGKFLCSDGAQQNIVFANKDAASLWETFTLIELKSGECVLADYNNHYFSTELDNKTEITATRSKIGSWEKFMLVKAAGGRISLKASNGKFLSFDDETSQLFAKADTIGEKEMFMILPVKE